MHNGARVSNKLACKIEPHGWAALRYTLRLNSIVEHTFIKRNNRHAQPYSLYHWVSGVLKRSGFGRFDFRSGQDKQHTHFANNLSPLIKHLSTIESYTVLAGSRSYHQILKKWDDNVKFSRAGECALHFNSLFPVTSARLIIRHMDQSNYTEASRQLLKGKNGLKHSILS